MTIQYFLPLWLSARISPPPLVYSHQPSRFKALLYLAYKFHPEMSAHPLLMFVSNVLADWSQQVFKHNAVGWVFCRSVLEPAFEMFGYRCSSPRSTICVGGGEGWMGLGCRTSHCYLVRLFNRGNLESWQLRQIRVFVVHNISYTHKLLLWLFKETGYPYCLQAECFANVSKNGTERKMRLLSF